MIARILIILVISIILMLIVGDYIQCSIFFSLFYILPSIIIGGYLGIKNFRKHKKIPGAVLTTVAVAGITLWAIGTIGFFLFYGGGGCL